MAACRLFFLQTSLGTTTTSKNNEAIQIWVPPAGHQCIPTPLFKNVAIHAGRGSRARNANHMPLLTKAIKHHPGTASQTNSIKQTHKTQKDTKDKNIKKPRKDMLVIEPKLYFDVVWA